MIWVFYQKTVCVFLGALGSAEAHSCKAGTGALYREGEQSKMFSSKFIRIQNNFILWEEDELCVVTQDFAWRGRQGQRLCNLIGWILLWDFTWYLRLDVLCPHDTQHGSSADSWFRFPPKHCTGWLYTAWRPSCPITAIAEAAWTTLCVLNEDALYAHAY